jgi:hypothetical protein
MVNQMATTFMYFDENRMKSYDIDYSVDGIYDGTIYNICAVNAGEAVRKFYKDWGVIKSLMYDEPKKRKAERIYKSENGKRIVVETFGENYNKCSCF